MTQEVDEIVAPYLDLINKSPILLSALYDTNYLPEQVTTKEQALVLVKICEEYKTNKDKYDGTS